MSSGSASPFARLRIPFAVTNVVQFTVILALFLALVTSSSYDTQVNVAKAGTIVMVVFGLTMAIG